MKNARQCIEILNDMINEQGMERMVCFLREVCHEKANDTAYDNKLWADMAETLRAAENFASDNVW